MRWKMICKDQDWKYLAIVMILAFLYAFGTYNEDSLTIVVGILEPMTHEQLMMSISAFPAFALLFLFYRIMAHHETEGRWKTLLAFPIQIRKYVAGLLPYDSTISSLTVIPSTGISYNPVVEAACMIR